MSGEKRVAKAPGQCAENQTHCDLGMEFQRESPARFFLVWANPFYSVRRESEFEGFVRQSDACQ
jgi:hypothetical protein